VCATKECLHCFACSGICFIRRGLYCSHARKGQSKRTALALSNPDDIEGMVLMHRIRSILKMYF
jgi:hypothetical protein